HTRFSRDWSSDVCSSDLQAHVVVSVQNENAAADARHGVAADNMPILLLINDISAAILCVIGLGIAHCARALLTKTDGLDLPCVHAKQVHHARYRFGTTLAQCQVVLGTTPCVSMAFDAHSLLRVAAKIVRVHFNHTAILLRYGIAVKLEIHRTLLCQRTLRVERVHNLARAGAVRSGAAACART